MRTPDRIKVLHIFTALVLCCGTVIAAPDTDHLQQANYTGDIEDDVAVVLAGCDEILSAAEKIEDDVTAALADFDEILKAAEILEGNVAAALAGCDEILNDARKIEDDVAAMLAGYDEMLEDAPAHRPTRWCRHLAEGNMLRQKR